MTTAPQSPALQPLQGVHVLSLALNLPGPAALLRCRRLGAACTKLEPAGGDPMRSYQPQAYATLHDGVQIVSADLKTAEGQSMLHTLLARTDVLLTSFRPSALKRLALDWDMLHARYPSLSQIAIVGGPGPQAEVPGHDLTYMAEHDLVSGLHLPPTLFADMGGALMASEAVLQAVLHRRETGAGAYLEIALSEAAGWLALPRAWGLTQPGSAVGGAHAGYCVYACRDGRVAVAALEGHFAERLCLAAGLSVCNMFDALTHQALGAWFATQNRAQIDALAAQHDLPLHTLPP